MEKYTVIIPTRDRAETLEATIRTCLRQTYANFEIIVSDNCSSDNTKDIVDRFRDLRIKYINPGRRLSMSGNFEFALGHVTEGFVMFIGADDGIMPDAINYIDSIVQKYKVGAVSCQQAPYIWHDFPDETIAGRLVFGSLRDDVEIRNSSVWLQKTLAFQRSYCFDLPNLYCGFVHKRIIDQAYKDGRYFRSITPDAYSAFATAIFIEEYAFSHRPFSIAGSSTKSNGASSMHPAGGSSEVNKFYEENDIEFCDGFVNCPSFEIICAETFAQLAKAFPEQCSKYRIDYKIMLHTALKNVNKKTAQDVFKAVTKMAENFSVKMDENFVLPKINISTFADKLRMLVNALNNSSKIIEISRSATIGVRDVADAALVAHVLMLRNDDSVFVTRRSILFKRLRKIVGL
jgi:glycosyltransferase involved in cell wall biosynthesis